MRFSPRVRGKFRDGVGRFLRFLQLGPTSGSMGFGAPAAIAAARIFRDRTIVSFLAAVIFS
jgi:acetolactate synthase I/II/III large subunit